MNADMPLNKESKPKLTCWHEIKQDGLMYYFNQSISQLFRTLLCILVVLSSTVVWTVLIFLRISNSTSIISMFLGVVPMVSAMIGIAVTFISHIFFISLRSSWYLSSFCFSLFSFCHLLEQRSLLFWHVCFSVQSAGAVEYHNCISASCKTHHPRVSWIWH